MPEELRHKVGAHPIPVFTALILTPSVPAFGHLAHKSRGEVAESGLRHTTRNRA